MLTPVEEIQCAARANTIDHSRTSSLEFVGNYVRRLPVNMHRMIENAYDWEHLPFVHRSSFTSIECVDSGTWGWRAKVGLPGGEHYQVIDLLVDRERHYWATTVFAGRGAGLEIHTQATSLGEHEIEVDVRFYLSATSNRDRERMGASLKGLYRQLYDEDLALMRGRQRALDDRLRWRVGESAAEPLLIGDRAALAREGSVTVETATGRVCVQRVDEQWIAFDAVCPHQGGPLDVSRVGDKGVIACPWHGYRFDATTGENLGGRCGDLPPVGRVVERGDQLFLESQPSRS